MLTSLVIYSIFYWVSVWIIPSVKDYNEWTCNQRSIFLRFRSKVFFYFLSVIYFPKFHWNLQRMLVTSFSRQLILSIFFNKIFFWIFITIVSVFLSEQTENSHQNPLRFPIAILPGILSDFSQVSHQNSYGILKCLLSQASLILAEPWTNSKQNLILNSRRILVRITQKNSHQNPLRIHISTLPGLSGH